MQFPATAPAGTGPAGFGPEADSRSEGVAENRLLQSGDRIALRQQAKPLERDIRVDLIDNGGAFGKKRGQAAGCDHFQTRLVLGLDTADLGVVVAQLLG